MSTSPIMSVSGIRGKFGESLTPELIAAVAYHQTKSAGGGTIVIGRDTRPTGPELAKAAMHGIRAAGGDPVDIGIAPTPTTCVAVAHLGAAAGIILTASHNPLPYNGYKMVHGSGRLYTGAECEEVYRRFRAAPSPHEFSLGDPVECRHFDAVEVHIERIVAQIDVTAIQAAKISIAIDSINGAAGAIFPQLLEKLGVAWEGVNTDLTGDFVHNPEPRPDHLTELSSLLARLPNSWGGFAFDPDADRLITMGAGGEPILEELTLAMALKNVLSTEKSSIATNLSTSRVIDDVAGEFGVEVIRTRIGEANVVEGMQQNGCRIGGEGNGGVIFPKISTVRDGLAGMALILELMAKTKSSLSDISSQFPSYYMVKDKLPCPEDPQVLLAQLEDHFSSEELDTQDGLKIIRPNSWVHIRPSNTEPILRCYAEAPTEQEARLLVSEVTNAVR